MLILTPKGGLILVNPLDRGLRLIEIRDLGDGKGDGSDGGGDGGGSDASSRNAQRFANV